MAQDKITIDINIFDDNGFVVEASKSDLTSDQISDIVDHARQTILLRRGGKSTADVLSELEKALIAAGVLSDE